MGNWDHKHSRELGRSLSISWKHDPSLDSPESVGLVCQIWETVSLNTFSALPSFFSPPGTLMTECQTVIRVLHVPDNFLPVYFLSVVQTGHFIFYPQVH